MFGEFGGVREIVLPGGGVLCVCAAHGLETCYRCGLEFTEANAMARQRDEIQVAIESGATLDRDDIHPIGTRVRLKYASGGVLVIRGSYFATIDPDPTFRYEADGYILQCVFIYSRWGQGGGGGRTLSLPLYSIQPHHHL